MGKRKKRGRAAERIEQRLAKAIRNVEDARDELAKRERKLAGLLARTAQPPSVGSTGGSEAVTSDGSVGPAEVELARLEAPAAAEPPQVVSEQPAPVQHARPAVNATSVVEPPEEE